MNFRVLAASAVFALVAPFAASAATIMTDGAVYDISTDNEFNYTDFSSSDAASDDMFTFGFASGGTEGATAFSVYLDAINSDITMFSAVWSSEANGAGDVYASEVLDTTGLPTAFITLTTSFADGDPQWLTVSWSSETDDDNALINVEVAAVPLPASALLLLAGLGGLGAARRFRKS